MKYRLKETVTKIKWTGKNYLAVEKFTGKRAKMIDDVLTIETPMYFIKVNRDDVILKDQEGRLMSVEGDHFTKMYEAVKKC